MLSNIKTTLLEELYLQAQGSSKVKSIGVKQVDQLWPMMAASANTEHRKRKPKNTHANVCKL